MLTGSSIEEKALKLFANNCYEGTSVWLLFWQAIKG